MDQADWFCATDYANKLLHDMGASVSLSPEKNQHPALRWAHSGAMALTGQRDGPAIMCPVPLASYADGIVAALNCLSANSSLRNIDGAQLLGERAALADYRRAGAISVGGSCRLLPVADGWLAVNLARDYDWEVLPAWLQTDDVANWEAVAAQLNQRSVGDCVERGRLLGLAIAAMGRPQTSAVTCCKETYNSGNARPRDMTLDIKSRAPLVIDLSSLWAGPLCTHLLQLMGARVLKVESSARPDGARHGVMDFYDLLNAGKASVALDLSQPKGREQLRQLLLQADIVIEASRPRALRQLGISAEEILRENPRATWVAISGYGREEPAANWIAFGDDAGVAAGLSHILADYTGMPMFCGDAIADPLTGLHAALAAWSSFLQGGGRLLSLSLCDVVTHCIQFAGLADSAAIQARAAEWSACISTQDIAAPRARSVSAKARPSGADTIEILSGLGIAC